MTQFAGNFSADEIRAQVVPQIPWGTIITIMQKSKSHNEMLFYINAIDELEKTELDNETIGLILCKDRDKYVAETTLKKSLMKLGISKYKLLEELPEYLEKKLNEIEG